MEIKHTVWAPLVIVFDSEEIKKNLPLALGDYQLAVIPQHVLSTIERVRSNLNDRFLFPFLEAGVCLQTEIYAEFDPSDDNVKTMEAHNKARRAVEEGLMVFRLYQGGAIGFNSIFRHSQNHGTHIPFQHLRHYIPWRMGTSPYLFKVGTIRDFGEFFSEFIPLIKEAGIEQPRLEYFSRAYHEPYRRNELVNLMIVLENLYLDQGEFVELSYKLQMRAACELGKDEVERKKIKECLADAIKKRNAILHSRKKSMEDREVVPILPTLEGLVRQSLREFLRKPDDFTPTELDSKIIAGF